MIDSLQQCNRIIDNFNNTNNIKDVIEKCTGIIVNKKSLPCPIHGGDNKHGSSISKNNTFTCWTKHCITNATPWQFIKAYHKLDTFKDVAIKVNSLFDTNIPIFEKSNKPNIRPKKNSFDTIYYIRKDEYITDCKELANEIMKHEHILLNAITGKGKTRAVIEYNKDTLSDYVILLVPTRALTEDVATEYKKDGYKLFYGDMSELPDSRFIVATYNKALLLQQIINKENAYREISRDIPIKYNIIVDEVHELMSKRNLLGIRLCNCIENLVKNSYESILMSANTEHIYKAYKDKGLFNRYISIDSKKSTYNCNTLNIKRIDRKSKVATITNEIMSALKTHEKILLMEDSKESLKEYSKLLDRHGINSVIINSDNKTDIEVMEHYNNIVKNNLLDSKVILTTSLINAGVNIKAENVFSIVVQDIHQVDTNKAEQFFGRIRTDNNNNLGYYIMQGEEKDFIGSYEYSLKYYIEIAEHKALLFNQYIFNKYGLEFSDNIVRNEFKLYSENENYKEVKDILYYDYETQSIKVDYIAIYEKARIKNLKFNYYNNDFMIEQLKGVKARETKVVTVAPIEKIKVEIEKEIPQISLSDAIRNILDDKDGLEEFRNYINGNIKPKDFGRDPNIVIYNNYKKDKKYQEMIRNIKEITRVIKDINDNYSMNHLINILKLYSSNKKKKEIQQDLRAIKIKEIYNKKFPLNTDKYINTDTEIIGDIVYSLVRKYCDCYAVIKKELSNKTFNNMLLELFKMKEKQLINKSSKGKKKPPEEKILEELKKELINTIKATYKQGDNLRLYSLK